MPEKANHLKKNIPYDTLRLGLACNANCLFCNVPPELSATKEMSTQEAESKISHLVSLNKHTRLDITGGEPTIRKNLVELIKYAVKKGVKVIQIQTNGILLSNKYLVKNLKAAGLNKVFAGLHSSIPEVHDYLVGLNGAFRKCIEGIKNALDSGIEVILNPVITTKNYKDLPYYIKFIKDDFPKIKFISLSVVQPRGRAWVNKYLIPRYGAIDLYIREALRLGVKYGLIINNPYCGLPLCVGGWDKYLERCVEYSVNSLNLESAVDTVYSNDSKVKGACCLACSLAKYCNGIWKEYAAIYSFSDLMPIIK